MYVQEVASVDWRRLLSLTHLFLWNQGCREYLFGYRLPRDGTFLQNKPAFRFTFFNVIQVGVLYSERSNAPLEERLASTAYGTENREPTKRFDCRK